MVVKEGVGTVKGTKEVKGVAQGGHALGAMGSPGGLKPQGVKLVLSPTGCMTSGAWPHLPESQPSHQ